MKYINFLLKGLLVVASLLFGGCAVVNNAKSVEHFYKNTQTEGLIVLSSTVNTGEIAALSHVTLKVVGKKTPASIVVNNTIFGRSQDSSLFIGSLPRGEYRIENVGQRIFNGVKYFDVSNSPLLPNIKIEAGKVHDLGRLILTAINTKVAVGRSKKYTDNNEALKYFAPEYAALTEREKAPGWMAAANKNDIIERIALATPQGLTALIELSDGTIVAGIRLGFVAIRSPEGRWTFKANTGDYAAVTATIPYEIDNNLALVIDDQGRWYRLDNTFELHPYSQAKLPEGRVTYVAPSPSYGEWFVAIDNGTTVGLYKANDIQSDNWELQAEAKSGWSTWSGARNVWVWNRPGGLGFASTEGKEVRCYDYESQQWTTNPPPENRVITGLSHSPHLEAIGVLTSPGGGFGGIFAKTHYTLDCGASWSQTKSPYKVKVSAPLLINDNTILEVGGVFRDQGIYGSTDLGKTWEKYSDKTLLSDKLWSTRKNGLFTISSGQWGIENVMHSVDGKNWKLDHTSYSNALQKLIK